MDRHLRGRLDGRSATSRTEKGNLASKPIWIPGREFLGSTPWDDPQGTAATIDWRRPDIDVWYSTDSPQEFGLRGSVDENDSIVHVFPRMPVSLACDGVTGDEGCMGVNGGGGITCACADRYPANCSCKKLDPPQFFACSGGDYDGMPCTRHAHCNSALGQQQTKRHLLATAHVPDGRQERRVGVPWLPGGKGMLVR